MKIETIRVGTYMLQNAPTTADKVAMHQSNLEVYCKLKHAKGSSACPEPTSDNLTSNEGVKQEVVEKKVSLDWPWNWGS